MSIIFVILFLLPTCHPRILDTRRAAVEESLRSFMEGEPKDLKLEDIWRSGSTFMMLAQSSSEESFTFLQEDAKMSSFKFGSNQESPKSQDFSFVSRTEDSTTTEVTANFEFDGPGFFHILEIPSSTFIKDPESFLVSHVVFMEAEKASRFATLSKSSGIAIKLFHSDLPESQIRSCVTWLKNNRDGSVIRDEERFCKVSEESHNSTTCHCSMIWPKALAVKSQEPVTTTEEPTTTLPRTTLPVSTTVIPKVSDDSPVEEFSYQADIDHSAQYHETSVKEESSAKPKDETFNLPKEEEIHVEMKSQVRPEVQPDKKQSLPSTKVTTSATNKGSWDERQEDLGAMALKQKSEPSPFISDLTPFVNNRIALGISAINGVFFVVALICHILIHCINDGVEKKRTSSNVILLHSLFCSTVGSCLLVNFISETGCELKCRAFAVCSLYFMACGVTWLFTYSVQTISLVKYWPENVLSLKKLTVACYLPPLAIAVASFLAINPNQLPYCFPPLHASFIFIFPAIILLIVGAFLYSLSYKLSHMRVQELSAITQTQIHTSKPIRGQKVIAYVLTALFSAGTWLAVVFRYSLHYQNLGLVYLMLAIGQNLALFWLFFDRLNINLLSGLPAESKSDLGSSSTQEDGKKEYELRNFKSPMFQTDLAIEALHDSNNIDRFYSVA